MNGVFKMWKFLLWFSSKIGKIKTLKISRCWYKIWTFFKFLMHFDIFRLRSSYYISEMCHFSHFLNKNWNFVKKLDFSNLWQIVKKANFIRLYRKENNNLWQMVKKFILYCYTGIKLAIYDKCQKGQFYWLTKRWGWKFGLCLKKFFSCFFVFQPQTSVKNFSRVFLF